MCSSELFFIAAPLSYQFWTFFLSTYLLQCWLHTTVGVQCMMAMNVCSFWSRTAGLATTELSRPCRSTTSTTMQVRVRLNDSAMLQWVCVCLYHCVRNWPEIQNAAEPKTLSSLDSCFLISYEHMFTHMSIPMRQRPCLWYDFESTTRPRTHTHWYTHNSCFESRVLWGN